MKNTRSKSIEFKLLFLEYVFRQIAIKNKEELSILHSKRARGANLCKGKIIHYDSIKKEIANDSSIDN